MEKRVKGTLSGIDGNAFMLIGRATTAKMPALTGCQRAGKYFQKLAKQQGFAKEWIQSALNEARSKDYDHLVETLLNNMEE